MEKFKKYAEILKDFSKDMELWKTCEEDDIADAERKYNQNALPEQIKKIRSEYAKKYALVRENALTKVKNETKSIKQRNQGKFKPDFVDLELLNEINAIAASGVQMTESEVEAYKPVSVDGDGGELLVMDILETGEDISKHAEDEAEMIILRNAIKKLSAKDQTIIKLLFGLENTEKKSQEEVASYFKVTQSIISRRKSRSLRRLRTEMERYM